MKPWLWLPPKLAHDFSPWAIDLYSLFQSEIIPTWNSFTWKNLVFKNRLGLAGGVDKNADHLPAWSRLGCGFVEIGTVTPLPQKPNAGKIFDRSVQDQALWNKMGFPSAGAEEVFFNLKSFKESATLPVLINIGKNRTTANELAHVDYVQLVHHFHSVADAFVVNISSPNTSGLRDLAKPESLELFLKPLAESQRDYDIQKPILLKLSPDLEPDELKRILDSAVKHEIDGFVLTNTTLARNTQKQFPTEGGLSGLPVQLQAKKALKVAVAHLGSEKTKKLVISVGGVMTAEDVFERISLGADLIEVYSALIFSGMHFFRKVARTAHEYKQEPTN
ncbi:MAG: quinone-dependent dihydroorotate dehydrogenase [Bdellovibrionaceae bacterium]|nr:quinone-dependent dihydroorotate dehydrogenase [Bdellovibrio sp.]